MHKKLILLVLALAFCLLSSAHAANIIWVAQIRDNQPDEEWVGILEAQAHTVDFRPGNWDTLDAGKIAELDVADLIIFSNTSFSTNFLPI